MALSTLVVTIGAVRISEAAPPLPSGKPNPDKIEGWCQEHGGTYSPPNESGYYACILPDGTVVACGGRISGCDVISAKVGLVDVPELPVNLINTVIGTTTKEDLSELSEKVAAVQQKVDAIYSACYPFLE
ncbi:MAG TPA: hypothetical protein VNI78_02165 [Vicinamibacterales bacterium]|nr:hypothetical protein [Vicinamibacterales bacterium]